MRLSNQTSPYCKTSIDAYSGLSLAIFNSTKSKLCSERLRTRSIALRRPSAELTSPDATGTWLDQSWRPSDTTALIRALSSVISGLLFLSEMIVLGHHQRQFSREG